MRRPWLEIVSLAAIVLGVHGVAYLVPFQFDDLHQLAQNPVFRDPASLAKFFTNPWIGSVTGHAFFYRPLLFATFLWDGVLGGGSPIAYRLTSLLILVVFALLVGRFARVMLAALLPQSAPELHARAGFLSSVLVCVHPLLNESVLLATGRSSLLMATFGLLALQLLVSRGDPSRRAAAVVAVTVLALLTKETAVVLAPLGLLVAWLHHRSWPVARRLTSAWPVLLPVVLYGFLYWGATRHGWFFDPSPEQFPDSLRRARVPWNRPAVGLLALIGLARLTVLPVGLSLIHPVPAVSAALRGAAPAIWILALATLVYLLRRNTAATRLVGFAGLWFVLALGPIVLAGLNTPMAEHRAVLALVGPAIAVAWGLSAIRGPRLARGVTVGLVALLAAGAVAQSLPWRSAITLWQREAERYPTSDRPWAFLATALEEAGELDRARGALERALQLSPGNVLHLSRAAEVAMTRGDLVGAGQYSAAGLLADPSYPPLLRLEAERLARLARLGEALVHAQRAVEAAPRSSASWNALGNVQYMMQDRRALDSYRRAVALDSANREAAQNLEMAMRSWGG